MSAPFDHQFQFTLERVEAAYPMLDVDQPLFGNLVRRSAGLIGIILQREQCADCIDFET
ncbi:hypothetical protein C7476_13927 [Phyllobacterium bourgognense]|uniref:Uncharacterized protein n=1 Tax=Phyllobacterium bourgognense TaxID=314236 RepID=A0A368YBT0_9HYPH|nr:hypothetical protein C7476_13927 [Phyllobacterium bourgognense]